MKIIHICETIKGGIATYLNLIDLSSNKFGIENIYIVPDAHKDSINANSNHLVYKKRKRGLINTISLFLFSLKTVKKNELSVLFFHSTWSLPILVLFRLIHIKGNYIYCPHGWASLRDNQEGLKSKTIKFIEKNVCILADRIINISKNEYDHAIQNDYKGKHLLIENAVVDTKNIEIVQSNKIDLNSINLLFIGRFDYQKGLDILIKSFIQAAKFNTRLKLHIIGESVLHDSKLSYCKDTSIYFHGWKSQNDVIEYYKNCDITIVPSRWEGFGLVVAESFREGTPVMVSDRGALPSLVNDSENGYVIPLSINSFTEAIINLDKTSLSNMRKNCRQTYESRFHENRFLEQLIGLYKNLYAVKRNI